MHAKILAWPIKIVNIFLHIQYIYYCEKILILLVFYQNYHFPQYIKAHKILNDYI